MSGSLGDGVAGWVMHWPGGMEMVERSFMLQVESGHGWNVHLWLEAG